MMKVIQTIIYYLVKVIIKVRYKLKIKGLSSLTIKSSSSGTLFLANHVALVDPIVLEYVLWKKFKPCPVAVDYLFKDKFLYFLLSKVKAISVPSFSNLSEKSTIQKFNKTYDQIIKNLYSGENILMYPSGQLTSDGKEHIRGQSLTFKIIQQIPDIQVVLIRTEGFWGSSFSKYLTGKTPSLKKTFSKALRVIMYNFCFFVPKRNINIYIEKCENKDLFKLDKASLNCFLENWFNKTSQPQKDVLSLVPYK